jgi:hypothetical protein
MINQYKRSKINQRRWIVGRLYLNINLENNPFLFGIPQHQNNTQLVSQRVPQDNILLLRRRPENLRQYIEFLPIGEKEYV